MKEINRVDEYWRELAGKGLNMIRASARSGIVGEASVVAISYV